MENGKSLAIDNPKIEWAAESVNFLVKESRVFNLSDMDGSEQLLCQEVCFLIIEERKLSRTAKESQTDKRRVRLVLGEKLSKLKESICKMGRNGGWSGFLAATDIPKRTADRYVDLYRRAITPVTKLASGQIPTSPEDLTQELERTARRLNKILSSRDQVRWFVEHLAYKLIS